MTEWLSELMRVADELTDTIMVIEPHLDDMDNDEFGGVAEVFSPPRVITAARKCKVSGLWAIDRLTERAPGEPWDLSRKSHQMEVKALLEKTKPGLLVGSPPCSWLSMVMQIN